PTPSVRRIAGNLLGVPGKKLIPGMERATTQDYLLIRSASTPFRSADEFVPFVMAVAAPLKGLPKVIGTLGFFRTLQVLKKAARQLGEPMLPLAATHYFSAVPIKFGDYAVRYALRPHQRDPGGARRKARDYLGAELAE